MLKVAGSPLSDPEKTKKTLGRDQPSCKGQKEKSGTPAWFPLTTSTCKTSLGTSKPVESVSPQLVLVWSIGGGFHLPVRTGGSNPN